MALCDTSPFVGRRSVLLCATVEFILASLAAALVSDTRAFQNCNNLTLVIVSIYDAAHRVSSIT